MKNHRGRRPDRAPFLPRGICRWVILFIALACLGVTLVLSTAADALRVSLVHLTARSTAALLTLFGAASRSEGPLLTTPFGQVEIVYECTALYPIVIVVAAILPFPCRWRFKGLGVGLGVCMILILNEVRILTLIYLDSIRPEVTETVHYLVWPTLIIFSIALLFIAWGRAALDGH